MYDAANRLSYAEDVSGRTTYTFDANGNQLTIEEPSGDITTNTWNGENRLIEVEHPDSTITEYRYNADGLRVAQDHDGAVTLYVYDGNNLLQETDDTGLAEAEFTYIPLPYAEVLSQRRDTESSFYLADGIRNIRQLTDDSQVVTDEYAFDAFGVPISTTGSTVNSQLYKGQLLAYRNDPHAGPELESSLHHRNLAARTGRFTSEDPAADDHNLYRPVGNNPVNREDPSGLESDDGSIASVQKVLDEYRLHTRILRTLRLRDPLLFEFVARNVNRVELHYDDSWVWHRFPGLICDPYVFRRDPTFSMSEGTLHITTYNAGPQEANEIIRTFVDSADEWYVTLKKG